LEAGKRGQQGTRGRGLLEAREGERCFGEADVLFRSGRYEEALVPLRALNRAYPNTKNVLFPMALCLEKLGRNDETRPLCAILVECFQDPRAMEMQRRLSSTFENTVLDSLEIEGDFALPDLGPIPTIPVPMQEEERTPPWKTSLMIGGGLLALLALLCLPFLLQKLGLIVEPEEVSAPRSALSVLQLGLSLIGFMIFQGLGTGVASLALGTVKKLPANTFSGVLLSVGMTLLGANVMAAMATLFLVALAPLEPLMTLFVVEHVVMLAVFSRVYRFGIGDAIVFFGFFFIFMCVAFFVMSVLLGTGFGMAAFLFSLAASGL
jgi:hypothetical protein